MKYHDDRNIGQRPETPLPNKATARVGSAARVSATPTSDTYQTDKYAVLEITDSEELEDLRIGGASSEYLLL